jgi:threonyl-tRNA synthetase
VVVRGPDGALHDLSWAPGTDTEAEPVAMSSPDGLAVLRHSAAHVLAQAVQDLFAGAKLGIGPPVEDGFYYDFDVPHPFQAEDLERIESRMREIIAAAADLRHRLAHRGSAPPPPGHAGRGGPAGPPADRRGPRPVQVQPRGGPGAATLAAERHHHQGRTGGVGQADRAQTRLPARGHPDGRLAGKVRAAVTRKIPLIVVVGKREAEARAVTVRYRTGKEVTMPLAAFAEQAAELVRAKSLEGAGHLRADPGV